MCLSCQKVHRRGAATKQHKLLTGEDMPKDPDKVTEDKPVGDTGLEGQHGDSKEAGSSSSMRAVYLEQLVVGSAASE